MPRGLSKIDTLAKEAKARSDAYNSGEGFNRALMMKDGQIARGRCLEEGAGVWYLYCHDLPRKLGQQYADKVLCSDQPFTDEAAESYLEGSTRCYPCEQGLGRQTRVILNFLRYDEPKLKRDAKGAAVKENGEYVIEGVEPAIVVCNFSTAVGGRLSFLESQYGPISNHVCTIHKTGDKNNMWMIDVVEPNKTPEPWEIKLNEKRVPPPKAVQSLSPKYKSIPLMNYGTMVQVYGGMAVGGGQGQPPVMPENNVYANAAQNEANKVTGAGSLNLGAFRS
jgi:hypothetical protein